MSDTFSDPGAGSPEPPGAPARGVLLVAAAVALGIGVLASVSHGAAPTAAAASTASSSTTTTEVQRQAATTTTTSPATHQAGSVKVLVANGTSVPGAAGKLKTKLASDGYDMLSPTDTSSPARASAVYFAAGYQGDAEAIAAAAGLTASVVQALTSPGPVASSSGAQVIVVVGPDLASTLQ